MAKFAIDMKTQHFNYTDFFRFNNNETILNIRQKNSEYLINLFIQFKSSSISFYTFCIKHKSLKISEILIKNIFFLLLMTDLI